MRAERSSLDGFQSQGNEVQNRTLKTATPVQGTISLHFSETETVWDAILVTSKCSLTGYREA